MQSKEHDGDMETNKNRRNDTRRVAEGNETKTGDRSVALECAARHPQRRVHAKAQQGVVGVDRHQHPRTSDGPPFGALHPLIWTPLRPRRRQSVGHARGSRQHSPNPLYSRCCFYSRSTRHLSLFPHQAYRLARSGLQPHCLLRHCLPKFP